MKFSRPAEACTRDSSRKPENVPLLHCLTSSLAVGGVARKVTQTPQMTKRYRTPELSSRTGIIVLHKQLQHHSFPHTIAFVGSMSFRPDNVMQLLTFGFEKNPVSFVAFFG